MVVARPGRGADAVGDGAALVAWPRGDSVGLGAAASGAAVGPPQPTSTRTTAATARRSAVGMASSCPAAEASARGSPTYRRVTSTGQDRAMTSTSVHLGQPQGGAGRRPARRRRSPSTSPHAAPRQRSSNRTPQTVKNWPSVIVLDVPTLQPDLVGGVVGVHDRPLGAPPIHPDVRRDGNLPSVDHDGHGDDVGVPGAAPAARPSARPPRCRRPRRAARPTAAG